MNVLSLLERSAARDPARPAVFRGEQEHLAYASLCAMVARLAGWFRGKGLHPGDRVALCMCNSAEYFVAMQAMLWAGLAMVPVNFKLHEREVTCMVEHSGTKLPLVSDDSESMTCQQVPERIHAHRIWALVDICQGAGTSEEQLRQGAQDRAAKAGSRAPARRPGPYPGPTR